MFNSSSKHHTVNMKILLITLACIAAATAAPSEKQKRDILPGDPRYGTDYHHHHHHAHENEVQITPAAGGYVGSYVTPDTDVLKNSFQVLHKTYGPPNHQPGSPLNNGYLSPTTTEVHKSSAPVPTYGIPDSTQHIPQHVSNTYLQPTVQDVKKTHVPTSTYGSPVQDVKTLPSHNVEHQFKAPSVNAPVTSYGTPVVADVKTTAPTVHHVSEPQVQPTHVTHQKTVVPQVHTQPIHHVQTKTVARPAVKAPVTHGSFQQSVSDFKSFPSTGFTGGFDTLGSSSGISSFPGFDTSFSKLSVPSTVFTSQPSFDTGIHSGFTGYPAAYHVGALEHHTTHIQVPQPFSVHVTKHVPSFPVVSHSVEVPRPYVFRVPQQVHVEYPQIVETKAPVVQEHFELPKTTEVFQQQIPSFQSSSFENFQVPSYEAPISTFSKPTEYKVPAAQNVHVEKESVIVENPVHTKTTVKATKEYVQPTDSNGGYIY